MMPARGIDLSKSWADQVEEEEEAATPIVTATHENTKIEEPSTAIELAHAWPLSAATEPLMPEFAMPTAAEQCEPRLPLILRPLGSGGGEDNGLPRHASAHGQEGNRLPAGWTFSFTPASAQAPGPSVRQPKDTTDDARECAPAEPKNPALPRMPRKPERVKDPAEDAARMAEYAAKREAAIRAKAAHAEQMKQRHRDEQRALKRARRANLTVEERGERQEAEAAATQARRAAYDDEQRQAERATNAAATQARRETMPADARHDEQQAQQQAQEARRAAADDEQRQAERDASAKAQRDRRGVTSLYNALQLPVGQREDRLLYDFHASGSGFATVNSSRLPTLEEGSALHTECVNTVREEIRLRGNVTIADRARMISTYAERQREATQLRSCGCCGTRDPSMWYSEPKRLHELPMDHWARIDDAAYTDLLNANVLELMNVKEEKVPVPRVEWHNCFECGGSAYHVIPEAVECDENGMPCIYVCKHCHKHWSRPRGEPVCERMDGLYDHLYWKGAPNDSVAAGDDFGRISHLKQKYGIETARSRLEQLVLASVRTQYVLERSLLAPLHQPTHVHHQSSVASHCTVLASRCSGTSHTRWWHSTTKRNAAAFTVTR